MKNYTNFVLTESSKNVYTMYTGVSLKKWESVWKNKNLKDVLTFQLNMVMQKFMSFMIDILLISMSKPLLKYCLIYLI
jgi:hypothetical protein